MNDPLPDPPNPDGQSSIAGRLIEALNAYRPIIKDLVIVLGVLATLGTSVYTSCQATKHGEQLQTIEKKADTAAVKSVAAAEKVDQAQTTALKTQLNTAKIVENEIGGPQAEKAVADSKAQLEQHIAATQETK